MPNLHHSVNASSNCVPVTVTTVPPVTGPREGDTDTTLGCSVMIVRYRSPIIHREHRTIIHKSSGRCVKSARLFETDRATEPVTDSGAPHNKRVLETTVAAVSNSVPLNRQRADAANGPGDRVTTVPPVTGPAAGTTAVTAILSVKRVSDMEKAMTDKQTYRDTRTERCPWCSPARSD